MNYNYLVFNTNAQIKMHKQGENRDQIFMFSLESSIAADSFVRVLDAFVEAIDLKSFGFAHVDCSVEGRPPYHPAVLLKLYIYGYRYGIRSAANWSGKRKPIWKQCGCYRAFGPGIRQ